VVTFRRLWSSEALARSLSYWRDTRPPAIATPTTKARTVSVLYGSGGLLMLAAVVLPHDAGLDVPSCATTAVAALLVAACTALCGKHYPRWLYPVLVAAGTCLITWTAAHAGGAGETVAVSGLYVFVSIDAFFFFARPWAATQLGAAVACCMSLAFWGYETWATAVIVSGGTVMVGVVVGWLVRLAAEAETDGLTGVANRRGFDRALGDSIRQAGRPGLSPAMVMFDLDDFKGVNDRTGHAGGDRLLREVTTVWAAQLADGQVLARFGGDEFALLLPGRSRAEAMEIAQALRAATASRQPCSAGVAVWEPGDTASLLAHRADVALYEAKRGGRNRLEAHPTAFGGRPERPPMADALLPADR
jgi:diguanylate cyclase (GGDEF)-like protein